MISLLAASLLLRAQGEATIFPKPSTTTLPAEVLDWPGFKYLPAGPRIPTNAIPVAADWSGIKGTIAPTAVPWRVKVVILERTDRAHERGHEFVWPGHYGMSASVVERVKRSLPQLRALVADRTNGAVDLCFDISEETEAISIGGGDLQAVVRDYLTPRVNGGRYEAEDGVFRGPYQSIMVIHPMGGETSATFEVQDTPVTLVGLPDVEGQEVDGALGVALSKRWTELASRRAEDAGLHIPLAEADPDMPWSAILGGYDAATEDRLRLLQLTRGGTGGVRFENTPWATGSLGAETSIRVAKDPVRGSVLVLDERGTIRGGGLALPTVSGSAVDTAKTPTFSFWMKSEARDPIVLQFSQGKSKPQAVFLGRDIPFAYDGVWHQVKIDLKPVGTTVDRIVIAPDAAAREALRETIGPIEAAFSDFELSDEAPDSKPIPEAPSPTSVNPEARARWASTAEQGDTRRLLLKDAVEAVKANAAAAALARLDPADEPVLIEDATFTFEPTVFTPAMRALNNLKTPTAREALRRAVRIAAADRGRGLAAEILAESGDEKLVPEFVGLNQARHGAARRAAIRALGKIKGREAALMRMAYLAQNDPAIKLEATRTADPNDDYQGRKLLWSSVNEPSDAVRLESLRRLSSSTVSEFSVEGLKGVHDDSVGVRIGLLRAWTETPNPAAVPAIRQALLDKAPRVRVSALDALAVNAEVIDVKDLPFNDADPRVQLALLRLCKQKAITVPAAVIERWRQSPDPDLRKALAP